MCDNLHVGLPELPIQNGCSYIVNFDWCLFSLKKKVAFIGCSKLDHNFVFAQVHFAMLLGNCSAGTRKDGKLQIL